MTNLPQKIAIIGLGLIGGSIFLGLKKRLQGEVKIIGVKRNEKIPKDRDLLIIATPILEIIRILNILDKTIRRKTLIMDVGSTKELICNHASRLKNKNISFVGTHPMAGRETSGFTNSDPNLFVNKPWIVCKENRDVTNIIKILGGKPILIEPKRHDKLVSEVSSLPLMVGSILINTVRRQKGWKILLSLASTGFRDTTRLASFDPKIKTEIVSTNKKNLLNVMTDMEKEMKMIRSLIESKNWKRLEEYFERGKQIRDNWITKYFS